MQLCVWAIRQWMRAAVDGRCVCSLIGAAFDSAQVGKGAAPFHAAMRTLWGNARIPIRVGGIDRPAITEDEAIIIEAVAAAGHARWEDLRGIALQLVFPDFAPALARSLTASAETFADAGLSL